MTCWSALADRRRAADCGGCGRRTAVLHDDGHGDAPTGPDAASPAFQLTLNEFLLAALAQAPLMQFFQQEQTILPECFRGLH